METHANFFRMPLSFCLLLASCNLLGQYNFNTNTYVDPSGSSAVPAQANLLPEAKSSTISCAANTFYAVDAYSVVIELTINGNSVTATQLQIGQSGPSLAYCNNLITPSLTPTFFSDRPVLKYFNGTQWQNTSVTNSLFNMGGNGNYLYATSAGTAGIGIDHVQRTDGFNVTTIYNRPGRCIAVADLGVDNVGNVYFATSPALTPLVSDSLLVVSPTGQVVLNVPFNQDMIHAYGAMVLNGTYYIAFGNSNPNYANSLMPVVIGSTGASFGTAISMPDINLYDLAACRGVAPTVGIEGLSTQPALVRLMPNPLTETTHLEFTSTAENRTVELYTIYGELVQILPANERLVSLHSNALRKGMYLILVTENKNSSVLSTKLIVD